MRQARSGLRPWLGSKGRGSKGRSPIGANLSGLGYKAASTPAPLPLLSPLPPRIKASGQPHKRYGIKHNRANAAAPEAVGGRLIIRRGSGGRRGRGDDRHAVPIGQRLERPNREARLPAWLVSNRCQARLVKLARMGAGRLSTTFCAVLCEDADGAAPANSPGQAARTVAHGGRCAPQVIGLFRLNP